MCTSLPFVPSERKAQASSVNLNHFAPLAFASRLLHFVPVVEDLILVRNTGSALAVVAFVDK